MIEDSELLELCNKYLSYNPETGVFIHKIQRGKYGKGRVAGTINKRGYRRMAISGNRYLAHRLAFLVTYEYLPDFIDHINGIKDDSRIINLRACTHSENLMNRGTQKNSKSGYKGVSWYKTISKWGAQITLNGKQMNLGYFKCRHQAARVYNTAARMYHGYKFCYTNIISKGLLQNPSNIEVDL